MKFKKKIVNIILCYYGKKNPSISVLLFSNGVKKKQLVFIPAKSENSIQNMRIKKYFP